MKANETEDTPDEQTHSSFKRELTRACNLKRNRATATKLSEPQTPEAGEPKLEFTS